MISKDSEQKLVQFFRWILPQIQLGKKYMFQSVISQVFLDDAMAWSDTKKNHASFVANEFAD